MPHILSANQFTKDDIDKILSSAHTMETSLKNGAVKKLLDGKIIACIFYEPSTRTRLSFETAAIRLGANVISAEDALGNSSAYKGETIEDTARTISSYADAIVIRHPIEHTVEAAAKATDTPIINAGDGANQHPSQGLLDLYTIQKEHGRLDHLSIAFVGDVLHSRTLRSLIPLLALHQGNTFHFISPESLAISQEYRQELIDKKISFTESHNIEDGLPSADAVYMMRVQKERFKTQEEYDRIKDAFILKPEHLALIKKEAIIMHPLPRVNEIDIAIDTDSRASYFRQAQNGLYIRMALLLYVFNLA
jgi:aspartate carbamoyltransferase catalytic subunit